MKSALLINNLSNRKSPGREVTDFFIYICFMIPGYDFSSLNTVDVTKLPAGTGFVILRGIRQNGQEDSTFQERYHALRDHRPEIIRMDYLFLNCYNDGARQGLAQLDMGVNYKAKGNGPMWIDLEADTGSDEEKYIMANRASYIQRVNDCINAVLTDPRYGRPDIGIYSNDSFLQDTVAHTWPDCHFWLASYQPNIPSNPAQQVKIHQFCQYGRLDMTCGNDSKFGNYDLNHFVGTQDELNALANI